MILAKRPRSDKARQFLAEPHSKHQTNDEQQEKNREHTLSASEGDGKLSFPPNDSKN